MTNENDTDSTSESSLDGSHTLPAAPVAGEQRAALPFPVIGVGASAGGVEALSEFFHASASDSGMAFVVIQHLAPTSRSLMAEILGRCTSMPVMQIDDGMRVEPDKVYVIRPGFTVTLSDGHLHLGKSVQERGHRHPIDDFFRSLAQEQKEKAAIVVLSGTGTNGTAGAQAVKAAGGLCVAQDPDLAEFSGMPRSLIHSGYADQVLPAPGIPQFLSEFFRHPLIQEPQKAVESTPEQSAQDERRHLNRVQALLRTRTGHDFRGYRHPTLLRRIQRRMGVLGAVTLGQYAQLLAEQAGEADFLASDLLINVTGFFRDPHAWDAFRDSVVVPLVNNRAPGEDIRVWVTACASGEEAYSLAILLAAEMERANKHIEVKIFATDASDKSLVLARAGVYPGGIEGDIPQPLLERYFDPDAHSYRIKKEIRDMVVFAPQNLLRDPPFSRVDICTCRNLLIYLEPDTQKRVLSLIAFALRDGGYLFLGNTESLGEAEQGFEVLSKRWRLYRRMGPAQHRFVDVPFSRSVLARESRLASPSGPVAPPSQSAIHERALLEEFVPPTVIVDRQERMLYIHGDTAAFLFYPQGELTTSLLEAARPSLRSALRSAFRQVTETHVVSTMDCQLDADDENLWVRITVAPLKAREGGRNLRVTFELRTAFSQPQESVTENSSGGIAVTAPVLLQPDAHLEDEIRILRRELQASLEAAKAANEELKASNEEILSINEELQSANEELETSKEELQSVNEELLTVNSQLQGKVQEIELSTNDLSNLLSSTTIAVVFLDQHLTVRNFTAAVSDLIDLRVTDVGRPIANFAPKFNAITGETASELIIWAASSVLKDLTPVETEVVAASGRHYLFRTLPYRTGDDHIEGVVLTFVDITKRKAADLAVETLRLRLESALGQLPAAVIIVEAHMGRIVHANRRAARLFGQPYPPAFLNATWESAINDIQGWHLDGRRFSATEWPLARSLSRGETVVDERIVVLPADGLRIVLSVSSAPVRDESNHVIAAVVAFWDITQLVHTEEALRASEGQLRLIIESTKDFAILGLDVHGVITAWNKGAQHIFEWTAAEMVGQSAAVLLTAADRAAGIHEQQMARALASGKADDERWHVGQHGRLIWATGGFSAARDEGGNLQGFVKIVRDDTARKHADDRLQAATVAAQDAQASAEAANSAKDEFVSMVSHELRTPLNTMRLWLRILSNSDFPEAERAEAIQTMERAVLAQQQMIDDLLDVSRMMVGKLRIETRSTRLNDVVGAAVHTVRLLAARKNLQLEFKPAADIGLVRLDPGRIQQVVWNLLSNAVKFTPAGGSICVKVGSSEGAVVIQVIDSGIGLSADQLPLIFERFRQAESGAARQHGGLGLGLAISKQLVELHGGSISVSSSGVGAGATFAVSLPMVTAEEAWAEQGSSTDLEAADLKGAYVLLVEDEPGGRLGVARLLTAHGAEVQTAASAAEARKAHSLRLPDVLISDIGLPGETGYQLMEAIRASELKEGRVRLPAIALTAFAQEEDVNRAMVAGFDVHMAKPVDPRQLLIQVSALVKPSRGG